MAKAIGQGGDRAMRQLKCHRCGSAELVLHEVYHENGTYDEGLFVNDQDRIQARGDVVLSQGEVQSQLMRIECEACGHWWRPRRAFVGGEAEVSESAPAPSAPATTTRRDR